MLKYCGNTVDNRGISLGIVTELLHMVFELLFGWAKLSELAAQTSCGFTNFTHLELRDESSVKRFLYTLSTRLTIKTTNIFKG